MKKILLLVLILGLCTVGTSLACEGPWCSDSASFDVSTSPHDGGISGDHTWILGGHAGGFGVAGGEAEAEASGHACYGTVSGSVDATGGGETSTGAFRGFFPVEYGFGFGVYVGSTTHTHAIAAGSVDLSAQAFMGFAHGDMSGSAGQASLNGSSVHTFNGHSWGIAGQGSIGGFEGDIYVGSIFWWPMSDSISASVDMTGMSYSKSYEWFSFEQYGVASGVGSVVNASTTVESSVTGDDPWWRCFQNSHVDGGWSAQGGAATSSYMSSHNGSASSVAIGGYSGSGSLGTNYTGSATGGSYASSYHTYGMTGGIMSAGASMSVTSTNHVSNGD